MTYMLKAAQLLDFAMRLMMAVAADHHVAEAMKEWGDR